MSLKRGLRTLLTLFLVCCCILTGQQTVLAAPSQLPTIDPIAEAPGQYFRTAPVLSHLGFGDDVALDDGWYQIDSFAGDWTPIFTDSGSTSWSTEGWTLPGFDALGEGAHVLYFKASDSDTQQEGESGEWSWLFNKDTTVPGNPGSVTSPSHATYTWSADTTIDITWTDAIDGGSGLDGYSILWDTSSSTVPDQVKDVEEGVQTCTSPALADGNSHYVHISSVDNAGNWQSTVHYGPFYINDETGSITGTVTDTLSGLPISNAFVFAVDTTTYTQVGTDYSDGSGTYSFTAPPGTYYVQCPANGLGPNYIPEYYNNSYVYSGYMPITVIPLATVPNIDFSLEIGGVISGTVTDTGTGLPMQGVNINAWDIDNQSWLNGTQTNASGQYTMIVPSGNYRVIGNPFGTNYVIEYYDNKYSAADTVTVTAPATVNGIDFSLAVGGSISGTVTDAITGLPVMNALVQAWGQAVSDPWNGSVLTDTNGNYTLYAPSDNYKLRVYTTNTGQNYIQEYYTDQLTYATGDLVAVTAPGATTADFSLELGATISGTVTDTETGLPLPNVTVQALNTTGNFYLDGNAVTDANGNYTFLRAPAGNYEIKVDPSGLGQNYISESYDNWHTWGESKTPITVTPPTAVTGIDFNLEKGGRISGTVTDTGTGLPVANASVMIFNNFFNDTSKFYTGITTDANGQYTSVLLLPGNYSVHVVHQDYCTEYYPGTYVHTDAQYVTVPGTTTVANIDFSLEPGRSISGTITDENSNPIQGVSVVAAPNNLDHYPWDSVCTAMTASDGSYTITGLPDGEYFVLAYNIMNGTHYYRYYNNHDELANRDLVTVSGTDVTGIDFSMGSASQGSLVGHIYEADGTTPVTNTSIELYCFDGTDWILMSKGLSYYQGSYYFNYVKPGDYRVKAYSANHAAQWYTMSVTADGSTLATVTDGGTTENIDFSLSRHCPTACGTDVTVNDQYHGVNVCFGTVTTDGTTNIIASSTAPGVTTGYDFLGTYYDVQTTAGYDGTIIVQLPYDDTGLTLAEEQGLRLYHLQNGTWEDCTSGNVDTDNNIITGAVTSLSWFSAGYYTAVVPVIGGGGGAAAPSPEPEPEVTVTTTDNTSTSNVTEVISDEGTFNREVVISSQDNKLTITIGEGTVGKTSDNQTIAEISVTTLEEPPAPVQGAHIIGLAYDIEAGNPSFDQPVTLTFTYDPAELPEGIDENDLILAWWDEENGAWVELETTVDPVTHTVSAQVTHFSKYAMIAHEISSEIEDEEVTGITVINEPEVVKEETVEVTEPVIEIEPVAEDEKETIENTPVIAGEEDPETPATDTETEQNDVDWWIWLVVIVVGIGAIIGIIWLIKVIRVRYA